MAGQPPQGQNPYQPQGYPPQPGYHQPQPGYPAQQGQAYPPQQGQAYQAQPVNPQAPYGVDPRTNMPYSEKQKQLAGFLQLLPLVVGIGGIGRCYAGHIGVGVAQIILSCTGIGQIWSIIDGIIILTNDQAMDGNGLPMRPN
ncbi:MAG: NINE protein [Planctomycetes bacterium]|nr:NINE protein [Planctomycetota bacterium]